MIKFCRPQKIALDDGRLLFSAVSHVGHRLILVGIHYFDRPIDYDKVALRIVPQPPVPIHFNAYVRKEYEPCVVLSAEVGEASITVEISYEGKAWSVPLEREAIRHAHWGLMTLFKDDYRLLPEFLRYYSALGVSQFSLYYNGVLNSVDWNFLRVSEAARDADVTVFEWDVPYWWRLGAPVSVPNYDKQGYQHHAQPMAMNHHLHIAKAANDYTFFVDLDEYIFTPKPILDRCCAIGLPGMILQCWFTVLEDDASYASFSLTENVALLVSETGQGMHRTKCLIKPSEVDLMGIHVPMMHADKEFTFLNGFFHICGFVENPRPESVPKTLIRSTAAQFVRDRFGAPRNLLS